MSAVHTRSSRSRSSSRDRRGISLILVGFALIVLVGFVSLAVDIGRLRLANAQLQTAADAAARAGAFSLPTRADTPNTSQDVINEAVTASLANPVINQGTPDSKHYERQDAGVAPDTSKDIHFGFWDVNKLPTDPTAFTEIKDDPGTQQDERRSANAVQVKVLRTAARNSPVKLIFAPILGVFTKDAGAQATAYITDGSGGNFGFIGLQSVTSNGNKAHLFGGTASDGTIDLENGDVLNTATVVGDARPGEILPGQPAPQLIQKNNSVVSGWTANLDYQLTPLYPPVTSVPADATTPIPSTGVLLGSSDPTHPFKYSGTIPNHFNMTIDGGYVWLYITQSFDLKDIDSITWKNPSAPSAARLTFIMTGTAPQVTYVGTYGNYLFYAHIYAPQCSVELGGTADFNGWAIGQTLSFQGNSTFTYDGTQNKVTGHQYRIHLVQ